MIPSGCTMPIIASNCFGCHNSGDIIDLYAQLNHVAKGVALKTLEAIVSDDKIAPIPDEQPEKVEWAPVVMRTIAYRIFAYTFGLSDKHRQHLLTERHLNPALINTFGFFTMPKATFDNRKKLVKALNEVGLNSQKVFYHVPGFYVPNEKLSLDQLNDQQLVSWNDHFEGFAIPFRNAANEISGVQIRMDRPKKAKYIWWTSPKEAGIKVPVDSSPFVIHGRRSTLNITEGFFKGLAINLQLRQTAVVLPGITLSSTLPKVLGEIIEARRDQAAPIEHLRIIFDADVMSNANVFKAMQTIRDRVLESPMKAIPITVMFWDEALGKGFDDLVFNNGGIIAIAPKVYELALPDFLERYKPLVHHEVCNKNGQSYSRGVVHADEFRTAFLV